MSTAASGAPRLLHGSRFDAQPSRLWSLADGLSLEESHLSSTAHGPRQPSADLGVTEAGYESAQASEF